MNLKISNHALNQANLQTKELKKQPKPSLSIIHQIISSIKSAAQKNKNKYQKVIKKDPSFSYLLYKPNTHFNPSQTKLAIAQLIMLKQLDKLMEEEHFLEKELNKLNFIEHNVIEDKEGKLDKSLNHYAFLREIWKKPNEGSVQQRIVKLNQVVGAIKGSIGRTIQNESCNNYSDASVAQIIRKTECYAKLQRQLDAAKMQLQDIKKKTIKPQTQKCSHCVQLLSENQDLIEANDQLTLKYNQLEEKYVKVEDELKRINEECMLKDLQIKQLKSNIPQLTFQSARTNSGKPLFQLKIFSQSLLVEEEAPIHTCRSIQEIKQYLTERSEGSTVEPCEIKQRLKKSILCLKLEEVEDRPAQRTERTCRSNRDTKTKERLMYLSPREPEKIIKGFGNFISPASHTKQAKFIRTSKKDTIE